VRLYPDQNKWQERINKVPSPLRQKALKDLDRAYTSRGFKPRSNGQDANGFYFEVDIRPGTDLAQVYDFLESTDTAAITVEPVDVERIYGKHPGTLGLRRAIEINGAASQGLELVEPSAMADALAAAGGIDWSGFIDDAAVEQFITNDLIHNGLLSETTAQGFPEEKPEPMGHFDDLGEFEPDYSVEEEWGED
jgi:hypothetical protein